MYARNCKHKTLFKHCCSWFQLGRDIINGVRPIKRTLYYNDRLESRDEAKQIIDEVIHSLLSLSFSLFRLLVFDILSIHQGLPLPAKNMAFSWGGAPFRNSGCYSCRCGFSTFDIQINWYNNTNFVFWFNIGVLTDGLNGIAEERRAFIRCLKSPAADALTHAFFAERKTVQVNIPLQSSTD